MGFSTRTASSLDPRLRGREVRATFTGRISDDDGYRISLLRQYYLQTNGLDTEVWSECLNERDLRSAPSRPAPLVSVRDGGER